MKMKKHTNIFQTQEEDKTSEKDLNETEINYLSDKEFKIMILKVRMEDKKRMHEQTENYNKEREYNYIQIEIRKYNNRRV